LSYCVLERPTGSAGPIRCNRHFTGFEKLGLANLPQVLKVIVASENPQMQKGIVEGSDLEINDPVYFFMES